MTDNCQMDCLTEMSKNMSDNRDKMSSRLPNGHFTRESETEMSEENVKWKSETNMLVGDARWTEWWTD